MHTRAGAASDLFQLMRFKEVQDKLSYCGVASAVIALNTLGVPGPDFGFRGVATYQHFTQENFFDRRTEKVRPASRVLFGGMALDDLAGFLEVHGAAVITVHAGDEPDPAARLRADLTAALGDPTALVLANYHRGGVGQDGGGHISPLAAFSAPDDAALILDVAGYRYPPAWVSIDALIAGMRAVDTSVDRSRGYVVVRPATP